MNTQYFLLAYFVVYIAIAFVWRSVAVYRATGINPVVLPSDDSAHGYIGRAFKLTFVVLALVVIVHTWWPGWLAYAGPISWVSRVAYLPEVGAALLVLSLVWVAVAQANMGASWRVGIDEEHKTELAQNGLFRVSRNPIFLGMRATLLGFFLLLPNAVTLAVLLAGEALIQVQVRLEEAHLLGLHGEAYEAYKAKVRRWL